LGWDDGIHGELPVFAGISSNFFHFILSFNYIPFSIFIERATTTTTTTSRGKRGGHPPYGGEEKRRPTHRPLDTW
jgi:hypothetical protein